MSDETKQVIVENLKSKKWFKKTDKVLQKEILDLPGDFEGFIKDLGDRPEEIGNVKVIKLLRLIRGNYLLIPLFEVESLQTKERFTYEYVSWKYGRETGSRGIIFLTENGLPKYFMVRKSQRFAIGKEIYDALGSLYPKFGDEKYIDLSTKIERQIKTILGVDELIFDRVMDLGILSPDSGQGNQMVALFAIYIDITGDEEKVFSRIKGKKFDPNFIRYDVEIFPIGELIGFIERTPDAYLLSIISRCLSLNLVSR